jgi:aspartate/methionine/tyrosine aminotransferase
LFLYTGYNLVVIKQVKSGLRRIKTLNMSGLFAENDLTPNELELARRRKLAQGGYIDLTGSNPTTQDLLFPPDILKAAAAPYWETRRYAPDPFGWKPAREAVARYYLGRTPSLALSLENIFLTASTSEAYSLLFALLGEPGDNLLMPEVTYPLFEYLASIHRLELKTYRMEQEKGWRIDQDSLRAAVDNRTRAVLIISPHNPTGAVVHEPIEALREINLPVICDEVFAEFTYGITAVPPLGTLHPDLSVFHLNGISKLFALPDLKLGWIALSGAAVAYRDRLELLNDTFLSCNSLTQFILPELFDKGMPFVKSMRERVQKNIAMALEGFSHSCYLKTQIPDGGYYLFPRVEGWSDEDALALYLLEEGVLVHPGYYYGYQQGAHIMISCLTEPETLRRGLKILLNALG